MSASPHRSIQELVMPVVWAAMASTVLAEVRWQVVFLHPEGARSSQALAAAGGRQGGKQDVLDNGLYLNHPVIWSRRSNTVVDLLPEGWKIGNVYGMDKSIQAGSLTVTYSQAAIWKGSSESYEILTPHGYTYSEILGVSPQDQVGYAGPRGPRAGIWRGTPESFVDLHPSTARYSSASATDGEYQGGEANFLELRQNHAALWHGTSASFVDMNPAGATSSAILGMAPGIQVGVAKFGSYDHAVLWRGTPESVVDLHPAYAQESWLYDTTGTIHVGYIDNRAGAEAGFWTGDDPNSFFNLQSLLPPGWSRSSARAVSVVGPRIYIAGDARAPNGQPQALLWIGTTVESEKPNRAGVPKP